MFRSLVEEVRFVVEAVSSAKKRERNALRYGQKYGRDNPTSTQKILGTKSKKDTAADFRGMSKDDKDQAKRHMRPSNKGDMLGRSDRTAKRALRRHAIGVAKKSGRGIPSRYSDVGRSGGSRKPNLPEEIRSVVEGGGSRGDKSDRQDALIGKSYSWSTSKRSKRSRRRDARLKHGFPDDGDVVFKQDVDHGRPSKPGSPGSMEKGFSKMMGKKFKYGKRHKRDVIGPKGKLPESSEYQESGRSRRLKHKRQMSTPEMKSWGPTVKSLGDAESKRLLRPFNKDTGDKLAQDSKKAKRQKEHPSRMRNGERVWNMPPARWKVAHKPKLPR